jgi:hypothetical protein
MLVDAAMTSLFAIRTTATAALTTVMEIEIRFSTSTFRQQQQQQLQHWPGTCVLIPKV